MSNKIIGGVVHWSASGEQTTVEDIRSWHVGRGWRDIGYHRVILHPDSRAFKKLPATKWGELVKLGRELDEDPWLVGNEIAAAAKGHNHNRLHICVVGSPGYRLHTWQKYAVYKTIRTLSKRYDLEAKDWSGHNQLSGHKANQCPGPDALDLIKAIRFSGLEHPDGPGGPIYGLTGGAFR